LSDAAGSVENPQKCQQKLALLRVKIQIVGSNAKSFVKYFGGITQVKRIDEAYGRLAAHVVRLLPSHIFTWHRDDGVHTITVGTREQLMAIGSGALIVGWLGIATANMVSGSSATDAQLAVKQAELARLSTQITAMKSDVTTLKGSVATTAAKIEARQQFLAALLSGKSDLATLAGQLPRAEGTIADLSTTADLMQAPSAKQKGKAAPVRDTAVAQVELLAPFQKIETEQLAFVDRATGAAQARYKDTQTLLRRLGLDPDRLIAQSGIGAPGARAVTGEGGPYIPVSAEALQGAEPRFKDLYLSWKKLSALESALASIPSYVPVKTYSYTSGFGVRYDPFNGGAAMHAGIDMAGSQGEPIYAAAAGVVGTAGRANGYGNLIELEHGRGMETRYGHLSAILVKPGQLVKQGQLIGRMGSTGRSTGTHLHYEVRIDGRAVNPRPYLEASSFVLAAQNRAGIQGAPTDAAPINAAPVLPNIAAADAHGGSTPIVWDKTSISY
jgi:murein DD-endopeptidase MepM/ murein hydrolase activator NlpD